MTRWNTFGGKVINRSSQVLVLAFDNPVTGKGWGHGYLEPNQVTRGDLDVDGLRARIATVSIQWRDKLKIPKGVCPPDNWWKLRNGCKATVFDDATPAFLSMMLEYDSGFGVITQYTGPLVISNEDFGWNPKGANTIHPVI
jgi:hypothetical protein